MAKKNDKCPPQGRVGADRPKPQIRLNKNNGLQGKNDRSMPKSKVFDPDGNPTPRRKRTIRTAKAIIDGSSLPIGRRRFAYRSLRRAGQPVREAKRIVQQYEADVIGVERDADQLVDLSDVQELRVKLIRRDYGIWSPHTDYLARMENDILTDGMSWEEFKRRSVVVMKMVQPLEKSFRKAEYKLARTGEWTPMEKWSQRAPEEGENDE